MGWENDPNKRPKFRERYGANEDDKLGAANAADQSDNQDPHNMNMGEHAAGYDFDTRYDQPLNPADPGQWQPSQPTGPYTQQQPPSIPDNFRPAQYPPQQQPYQGQPGYPPQPQQPYQAQPPYPPQQQPSYPPQPQQPYQAQPPYPPQQQPGYPPQQYPQQGQPGYPPQPQQPYQAQPPYPPQPPTYQPPAAPLSNLPSSAQELQSRLAGRSRAETRSTLSGEAKKPTTNQDGLDKLFDAKGLPCAGNTTILLMVIGLSLVMVCVMAFLALGSLDRHLGLGLF